MKDLTHIIVWAYRGGLAATEKLRFAKLLRLLEILGYEVHWVEAANEPTASWVADQLPANTRMVFASDVNPAWIADLANMLRKAQSPLPLIWIHDASPSTLLEYMTNAGVHDILSGDAPAADLGLRLRLRWRLAAHLSGLESQLHVQEGKSAKSETSMKQREEFLSVCAHDLRSPLGLIQSSLSMVLAAKPQLTEQHTELLTRAKRQATQALHLVHDLLDVMSFEQGFKPRYQLLNLNELLEEFHQDYAFQAAQKGVKLHYNNSTIGWRVVADAERIRQLLQNLVVNALKFTDPGKNIFLDVSPFMGRRRVDPAHPMLTISIRDEGRGIPQKEIQRIFDRFTQVRDYSRAEGRGLGLTVAKQISTLHDGNLWVESEEGKGSTFYVLFPNVVSRTTFPRSKKKNRMILVGEASADRRENVFGILRRWGYEVTYAKDAIDVVTQVHHLMPAAVLLSPGLPKMTDEELVNLIKGDPATSGIPLLMALEPGQRSDKELETLLIDQRIEIPLVREAFERAIGTRKKFKEAA